MADRAARARLLLVLVGKVVREQRATLAFCSVLLTVFFTLGTYLFVTFGSMHQDVMARLSPQLVVGLLGGALGTLSPLETWLVTLFGHPLVLVLFSVVVIAIPARALAGEVDRGTIDVLLSCPVPRAFLPLASLLVLVAALVAMAALMWLAMLLGLRLGGIEPPTHLERYLWLSLNLVLLWFAAAGVSMAIAASVSEQGQALGRALGFVVISFFVNLIASLWRRIEIIDVLSLFHYYRPQPVVAAGGAPWRDLLLLLVVGATAALCSIVVFVRRDIATV